VKLLKTVRPRLRDLVRENVGFKLGTLILSVVIWAWIQSEQVVEESAWVRIEYQTPEGLVMAQMPTRRVRVTVSGTRGDVKALRKVQETLSLAVDMGSFEAGVQTVDFVDAEIAGLPSKLEVIGLVPNSLQVELEPRAIRIVPLEPAVVGRAAEGYRVAGIELAPNAVELAGPASTIAKVESVSTEGIAVGGLTESATRVVRVTMPEGNVARSDDAEITASIEIEAVTATKTFPEVPVLVRSAGWEPQTAAVLVRLTGPVADLEAVLAEHVTALVLIPEDTPPKQITVALDPDAAARIEISHGGSDQVRAVSIEPARVVLEPAQ